jgi:hypothetical protein
MLGRAFEASKGAADRMFKSVAILALVCVLSGCGVCADEPLQRWADPEGESEVLLVRRDCGATTDYSYLLAVVDSGKSAIRENQVFYVSDAPLATDGLVEWIGPEQIRINEERRTQFERLDSIGRVRITYGES